MSNTATVTGIHSGYLAVKKNTAIKKVFIQDSVKEKKRITVLIALMKLKNVEYYFRKKIFLDKISKSYNHQGVVVLLSSKSGALFSDIANIISGKSSPTILVMDRITNVGNIGACLRTACCAGIDAVVSSDHETAGKQHFLSRASSGGMLLVPYFRMNSLTKFILEMKKIKGMQAIGTISNYCDSSRSLYEVNMTGPSMVIVGSESSGVRKSILELCDQRVFIPVANDISSLNVSVAAAIVMYEIFRQRKDKHG